MTRLIKPPWANLVATFALLILATGCSPLGSRAGVSIPGYLFKNTITPLNVSRPPRDASGTIIPAGLVAAKVTTYQVIMPFTYSIVSIGWGDMSRRAALEEGRLEEVIYADAQTTQILGIFEKVTIQAYGKPTSPNVPPTGTEPTDRKGEPGL